jgi:peroxiredoxin
MMRTVSAVSLLCGLVVAAFVHAGIYNSVLNLGDAAPAWIDLPGIDGKKHSLADLKDKDVVVVVFTCNSCPIAVDYEDRILAFAKKHCGPNDRTALVAINVNVIPEDRLPKMKERAKEKEFTFPYLFDETQKIARAYGALYTPEFFVLNKQRKVVYMGAMDDKNTAKDVKVSYLEPALASALKGEPAKLGETLGRGCRIRYKRLPED